MSESKKQLIYERLSAILKEVGAIGKNRENTQQRYSYRSIDDVVDRLHGLFAKHSIIMSPGVVDSQQESLPSTGKTTPIHVSLKVEYTFICSEDGSQHKVGPIVGEAIDYGDKANAKAMTMATKTMLSQVFLIPFQDVYDTDQNDVSSGPSVDIPAPSNDEQSVLNEIKGNIIGADVTVKQLGDYLWMSKRKYPTKGDVEAISKYINTKRPSIGGVKWSA